MIVHCFQCWTMLSLRHVKTFIIHYNQIFDIAVIFLSWSMLGINNREQTCILHLNCIIISICIIMFVFNMDHGKIMTVHSFWINKSYFKNGKQKYGQCSSTWITAHEIWLLLDLNVNFIVSLFKQKNIVKCFIQYVTWSLTDWINEWKRKDMWKATYFFGTYNCFFFLTVTFAYIKKLKSHV